MSIYPTRSYPITKGLSEFEILKTSHKFLREDDSIPEGENENGAGSKKWEDKLAEKYYESLYREFAVCDLKHYKSGNFALRWRTESEVLSGAGESTCGNTRCKYHFSLPHGTDLGKKRKEKKRKEPQLTTLELPFTYIEHGEAKSALVKVVLCSKCVKKLMWKRKKDKEEKEMRELGVDPAIIAMMDNMSEDDAEGEEEQEDEAEKAGRKGKEKEREKEKPTSDRTTEARQDEDSRRMHPAIAAEVEERSGKKHRRHERDSHEGRYGHTTREPRSRRRSSRSRSPGRRHYESHSHSSPKIIKKLQ